MDLIVSLEDKRLDERLYANLTASDDILIRVTRDSLRAVLARLSALEKDLEFERRQNAEWSRSHRVNHETILRLEAEVKEWTNKCVDARLKGFDSDAKRIFAERALGEKEGANCRMRTALKACLPFVSNHLAEEHIEPVLSQAAPCSHASRLQQVEAERDALKRAVEWALSHPYPLGERKSDDLWFRDELRRRAAGEATEGGSK